MSSFYWPDGGFGRDPALYATGRGFDPHPRQTFEFIQCLVS